MADETPENQTPAPQKSGGYGKRPMWQWVLLYLIVGGILYYIAYLLFFAHTGGGY